MEKNGLLIGAIVVSCSLAIALGVGLTKGAVDTDYYSSQKLATAAEKTEEPAKLEADADTTALEDKLEQTIKLANGYQQDVDAYASCQQAEEFATACTVLEQISRAAQGGLTQTEVDAYMTQVTELKTQIQGAGEAALGNAE